MAKVNGLTAVERPDTLARSAYLRLQEAIRDGVVRHGPLYSENELAETLGMSRTPVREAVIALTREGLLEVSAQRGFSVRALSADEQAEVFDLRGLLETHVVRRLAEDTPEDAVADLRAVLERQARVAETGTRSEFLVLDEEFHLLMPRLAALPRTGETLGRLRGAMWLLGQEALTRPERDKAVLTEHHAIVDAIAAGDPGAAAAAVAHHLDTTRAAADAHGRGIACGYRRENA
ncbi:GntR family transcriptional regulator [Actinomycetospora rhizophila]|uniref:GntR family transcriptional regulator n=1 Tax=Actinomycetospora rhizophila TaxID=1416876 RepID=A0ABV9ZL24_9PSEU